MNLNRTGLTADEINWDTPMLDQDAMVLRSHLDPTFKYVFQKDRTDDYGNWMTTRIIEEHANVVTELIGRTGSGKSYGMLGLVHETDKKFSPKRNILYSLELIMQSEHRFEAPISWGLDEVARNWGIGSWRASSEWENYIESIRKKQHSVFTATPVRKPQGTTMWCLEPVRMSREDEVTQFAISNEQRHHLGYVLISAPWHFMPKRMVEEYEKQKDDYIMSILKREGNDPTTERIGEIMAQYTFSLVEGKVTLNGMVLTTNDILEIVNQHYPFLKRNNEAYAIAEGIKARLRLSAAGVSNVTSPKPNEGQL